MGIMMGLKRKELGDYDKMDQEARRAEAVYLAVFHKKEFDWARENYDKKAEDYQRKVYLHLREHHSSCNGCIRS